jgi:rhodanese-related sulfurtransferase
MIKSITPKELKTRLDSGEALTIIDVRERWELARASVLGALHIAMNDIPASLERIPKDQPVALLCHHGGRSMQAAVWLRMHGYDNVMNVEGGIERWSREADPSVPLY